MSSKTSQVGRDEAIACTIAELNQVLTPGATLSGSIVTYVIDSYCVEARCTRASLPKTLADLYQRALHRQGSWFNKEELLNALNAA